MDDSKNTFLAKPSKIVISLGKMTIFKKSDLKKKRKSAKKSMKNRMLFKSSIWEAFWKGFGRPKSMIFVIFSIKNASKK